MAKLNNLPSIHKIYAGQVLQLPGNITPYQRMPEAKENLEKIGYGGFAQDREWDPQFNRAVIDFVYAYGLNEKYYAFPDAAEANMQLFDWLEQAAAGKLQPKIKHGITAKDKEMGNVVQHIKSNDEAIKYDQLDQYLISIGYHKGEEFSGYNFFNIAEEIENQLGGEIVSYHII